LDDSEDGARLGTLDGRKEGARVGSFIDSRIIDGDVSVCPNVRDVDGDSLG
jgi:hypothetical protein